VACFTEYKVFNSEGEAQEYGKRRESEFNDGTSIEKKALNGYYFKCFCVSEVTEIDGFEVDLMARNQ
jgi:hypothetical protein